VSTGIVNARYKGLSLQVVLYYHRKNLLQHLRGGRLRKKALKLCEICSDKRAENRFLNTFGF
jgi:hypothetical protein